MNLFQSTPIHLVYLFALRNSDQGFDECTSCFKILESLKFIERKSLQDIASNSVYNLIISSEKSKNITSAYYVSNSRSEFFQSF